jgi:hypothetical protein
MEQVAVRNLKSCLRALYIFMCDYICFTSGSLRSCWNFSAAFSSEFNDAHRLLLNTSQDFLAKLPKRGPTINGPWAQWPRFNCDFNDMQKLSRNPNGVVVEADIQGCLSSQSHPYATSCMAAFLMHVRDGMYLSCVDPHESKWGGLPPFFEVR